MRTLRLVSVFILFLLAGGPILLLTDPSYADCCMCGWGCYDGCTCPGTPNSSCAWCAAPGPENLQVNAMPSDATLDVTAVRKPVPSIAFNSHSVDRLIRRVGTGQCAANNSRLKITDGENSLKLDQVFLKDYTMQDIALAFQVATKGEK